MMLTDEQSKLCEEFDGDLSNLRALFINCTLKPSPEQSHTEGLMGVSQMIMDKVGVDTEMVRAVDWALAPGVYPDMTEQGAKEDAWPELFEKVEAANILVVGTPVWLGERSSVCSRVMERLYAMSGQLNEEGQYAYYGRVGGCVVTGNEDGAKHCATSILYGLQHIGYVVPPQADAGWVGEAGPGPSYLDEGSGGPENEFTQRNVTFMTWNLMHLAKMLDDAQGIPAFGNQRTAWDEGSRFGYENPEHR